MRSVLRFLMIYVVVVYCVLASATSAEEEAEDVSLDPLFPLYLETRLGEMLERRRSAKVKPWMAGFEGNELLGTNEIIRMTSAACPAGGGMCDINYKRVDPRVPEL
jgi:hypothetical protein